MYSRIFVAYGSNLTLCQIQTRCPEAELVGTGIIPNYKMQFREFATIIPCPGAYTPAVVWKINHNDEESARNHAEYPYHKEKLLVKLDDGNIVHAIAFILDGGYLLPPSTQYFNALLQAYKDFGLNTDYLFQALKYSKQSV
jgi:hypothetical protein